MSVDAAFDGDYFSYEGQFFGTDRHDWLISATFTVTKDDWPILGFLPQLVIGYQRDISSVDLFSFDREYLELGLSRHF